MLLFFLKAFEIEFKNKTRGLEVKLSFFFIFQWKILPRTPFSGHTCETGLLKDEFTFKDKMHFFSR